MIVTARGTVLDISTVPKKLPASGKNSLSVRNRAIFCRAGITTITSRKTCPCESISLAVTSAASVSDVFKRATAVEESARFKTAKAENSDTGGSQRLRAEKSLRPSFDINRVIASTRTSPVASISIHPTIVKGPFAVSTVAAPDGGIVLVNRTLSPPGLWPGRRLTAFPSAVKKVRVTEISSSGEGFIKLIRVAKRPVLAGGFSPSTTWGTKTLSCAASREDRKKTAIRKTKTFLDIAR